LNRGVVILIFVFVSLVLLSFVLKLTNFLPVENSKPTASLIRNSISPAIQKQLKTQVINQFYNLVDYDLDALDVYAPKDEEMEAYYKIFDENAFQEKYKFFAKNYATQGMTYGEDAFYDRDLIMRIGARGSVLNTRSIIMNSEEVYLGEDEIKLDTVYVQTNKTGDDFYDLHIRFYHPKSKGYYEFVNEACWLTDRTCINTLTWSFLGRYNPYTKKYSFSELNIKNL